MTAVVTLTEAQSQLRQWTEALARCASGESYSIGNRTLTRQDVATIRGEIRRWHNTVTALEDAAQGRTRGLGARAAFPAPGSGGAGGIVSQTGWEGGA